MADSSSDDLETIREMIHRLNPRLMTPAGVPFEEGAIAGFSGPSEEASDEELAATLDSIAPIEPDSIFVRSIVAAFREDRNQSRTSPVHQQAQVSGPEAESLPANTTSERRPDDPTTTLGEKIAIFDTTMRDGRQGRFAPMSLSDRLTLTRALVAANVDVIELGCASTEAEIRVIQKIARQSTMQRSVSWLDAHQTSARSRTPCWPWRGLPRQRARVHVALVGGGLRELIGTPAGRDRIFDSIQQNIALVHRAGVGVEFSVEDGARISIRFLRPAFQKAVDAGASILDLADSLGVVAPTDMARRIRVLRKWFPTVILSAQCHNDMGLAVANTLAACHAGARQVHCTVNGVGLRAGITALDEVVLNIDNRRARYRLWTQVEHKQPASLSHMVSAMSGLLLPRNKPFVGADAEIPRLKDALPAPETLPSDDDRSVGKSLTAQQIHNILSRRGYAPTDDQIGKIHESYKDLKRRKPTIYESDLVALMFEHRTLPARGQWCLVNFWMSTGFPATSPEAHVTLADPEGRIVDARARGSGPIDAICKAISQVTFIPVNVNQCVRSIVNRGGDALNDCTLALEEDGLTFTGRAVSTDVMKAVVVACVRAVNEIYLHRLRKNYGEREEPTAEEDLYQERVNQVVYSFPNSD
jgi:2-isopropylmalate synthase